MERVHNECLRLLARGRTRSVLVVEDPHEYVIGRIRVVRAGESALPEVVHCGWSWALVHYATFRQQKEVVKHVKHVA